MRCFQKILRGIGLWYILVTIMIGVPCMVSCHHTQCSYKLVEHSMDYHAVISSELKQTSSQIQLPVYEYGGKYYVLAERVVLRKHVPLLQKTNIGRSPRSGIWFEYHHNVGDRVYYEVQIIERNSEKLCTFSPGENAPALNIQAEPLPTFVEFLPVANMVQGCHRGGDVQIFNFGEERFSWRAIYAVPAAGIAFIAIDVPIFIVSATGYLIGETIF